MRAPYRVAVWGPGAIGSACIDQAISLPELQLVGVLAYSKSKEGMDAGVMLGGPACGVKVTTDCESIFAAKPDCVIHTARDHGDFRQDADVIEMLERGINVISSMPYQNIAIRGPEVVRKFETAGRKGGATLHGSGINPGFAFERLMLTATGLSNEIHHMKGQEFVKIGAESAEQLIEVCGFALPPEEARKKPGLRNMWNSIIHQQIYFAGQVQGLPIERIEHSVELHTTPVDFQAPTMMVRAGTVARMVNRWDGYSGGRCRYTFECFWYLNDAMRPDMVPCDDFYAVIIEGKPSLRLGMELKASVERNERFLPNGHLGPVYYATASALLQAIPAVVAAAPGIKTIDPPSNSYWKVDMRL